MKVLSKNLFVGGQVGLSIIGALGILVYAYPGKAEHGRHLIPFMAVISFSLILLTIMLWNKAWASIQDGHARLLPNKAVGLALIPVFNFYWFFPMMAGFAVDYNNFLKRHHIEANRIPVAVMIVFAVLSIAVTVLSVAALYMPVMTTPLLGVLAAHAVTGVLVVYYVVSAMNVALANSGHKAVEITKTKVINFSWSWLSLPALLMFWVLIVWTLAFNYEAKIISNLIDVLYKFQEFLLWPQAKDDPFFIASGVVEPQKSWYTLGLMGNHIWYSFKEVLVGFILATVAALVLGFWAGFSRGFREFITPLNGVFMSIPAIAWAPLIASIITVKFVAIVIVVYIAAVSPMIIAIMEGVLTIKGGEVRAARALGAKPRQLFIYVYLPASLPFITAGMRIGFSQAWRALVAAEMIVASGVGLGHMVKMSEELGDPDAMMLGIVFIGLLSFIFERLIFRRIEKHYEVWRLG